jgi:predicted aspartyl protease
MIRNVTLSAGSDTFHVDAILDTGSTHCVVPPDVATPLGFHRGNRLGVQRTNVVGGGTRLLDRHCLEHVRVGTARAHRISFVIAECSALDSVSSYSLGSRSYVSSCSP